MKRKAISILKIIILLILTFMTNSDAATLNLSTDLKEINAQEEIIVSAEADKNIETTTFYLKYDNTKLEFVENLTTKASVKDYPEEGTLRVAYFDIEQNGEKTLKFKFKSKANISGQAEISITNLTAKFVDDPTVYTAENLSQSTFRTLISTKEDNIIKPWMIYGFIIVGVLLVVLVIVNVIYKRDKKKVENK